MNIEYVDVLTPGGVVTIDATSSKDNGEIKDADDARGTLESVRRGTRDRVSLIDQHGWLTVVEPHAALAFTYYEAPSKLMDDTR
jgi:hypothetical protein